MSFGKWFRLIVFFFLAVLVLTSSKQPTGSELERIRSFTRPLEFDFGGWTLGAVGVKLSQFALQTDTFLPESSKSEVVLSYLNLVGRIQLAESQLEDTYANPAISDPEAVSLDIKQELQTLHKLRDQTGPLAETIVQNQIGEVLSELGLTLGGQTIPPLLFHSTPLPTSLIVSPRNLIRQEANISLKPDMPIDLRVKLENEVDGSLNRSSLVVNVGGIGVYPTMVLQTTDLNFMMEVVAHEWTHNFLTLRPLGINYTKNDDLRTINETVASIAGKEVGRLVMERYYPGLIPKPPEQPVEISPFEMKPPEFDFRAEMRITRVTVDKMLSEGKIDEAESYMQARRLVFWDHGYHIRKLNQAYFAFYGAYADEPGGAAGFDPVGAAVRELRAKSPSLTAFLNRISWVSSYQQLERLVSEISP
jgi:hypothetical protein